MKLQNFSKNCKDSQHTNGTNLVIPSPFFLSTIKIKNAIEVAKNIQCKAQKFERYSVLHLVVAKLRYETFSDRVVLDSDS